MVLIRWNPREKGDSGLGWAVTYRGVPSACDCARLEEPLQREDRGRLGAYWQILLTRLHYSMGEENDSSILSGL